VIFVVCFVPLGLYLLLLGHINRQSRPVVVSGTLDFIGVLFAASGFLLFGGPAILTGLNENWRSFWLLGDPAVSRDSLLAQWQFWVFLWALYFLCIAVLGDGLGWGPTLYVGMLTTTAGLGFMLTLTTLAPSGPPVDEVEGPVAARREAERAVA